MPNKSQRGSAFTLLVILVSVFISLGGVGLYMTGGLPESHIPSFHLPSVPGVPALAGFFASSPRVTEKDFDFIDDPLIRKNYVAMSNSTAFRTRSKALMAKDVIGENLTEVQLDGDRTLISSWNEEKGKRSFETIIIDDATYIKDYADGAWWKQAVQPEKQKEMQGQMEIRVEDFKDEYTKERNVTYKKLGEESCGPLTCYKYEQTDPDNAEANRVFWFDTKKYLTRKEESGFGEWRYVATYEYDGIRVKAPSPTKDVPEGKSVYDYLVVMPSTYEGQ